VDKKKILLIDDEQSLTRLLKLNLEKTGAYEVRDVNHALDGLTAAREFRPDLILLDIVMPGMTGDDVAAQLRADPDLKGIPIVFLTAVVTKEEARAQSGTIGGFPFLAKPVDAVELVEYIEKILSMR